MRGVPPSRRLLFWLAWLAAVAACSSPQRFPVGGIFPPPPEPKLDVAVEEGRVVLDAVAVTREEVLRRVAHEAGVELRLAASLPEKVTLRLRGAPLDDVLRALLTGRNYLITYSPGGKPRKVVVRPGGTSP